MDKVKAMELLKEMQAAGLVTLTFELVKELHDKLHVIHLYSHLIKPGSRRIWTSHCTSIHVLLFPN